MCGPPWYDEQDDHADVGQYREHQDIQSTKRGRRFWTTLYIRPLPGAGHVRSAGRGRWIESVDDHAERGVPEEGGGVNSDQLTLSQNARIVPSA